MRGHSFASLASLLALLPLASTLATPGSIEQRDDALANNTLADDTLANSTLADDAQLLDLFQQQALNATLDALDIEEESLTKRGETASCTRQNLEIRREYGSMSTSNRQAYSNAVLCLQSKTANTPSSHAPGAKTRYDDFVATHIDQTPYIHYSGTFLGWHRYFTWVYEQALRTECGYQGPIPYWNWPKYASAPQDSPIFNGDEYSMGGNGEYIPHSGTVLAAIAGTDAADIVLAPGLGGGCVQTGPFKDMKVNLGPVSLLNAAVGPDGGLGYNPRCLKRDVGPGVALRFTNYTSVLQAMLQQDIASFQLTLQGEPGSGSIGVHGGGHYTINGDPGGDLFVSPGDPAFFLHHGQIDRLWSIWQALDPLKRQNAISGTGTLLNEPPSADTTLNTIINVGYAGGTNVSMSDIMSTTKGPFCYIYL
ncbi:Tyrosinase-like protein [Lachnellula willkommii]|uniref:Tyrosinase-like protein n=1 Tax=Lachnellula willkommii TaxID=215461 RepID=A0A559MD85_9HELO|nr:Tyrosinase-like protein [Lachnellula willkommii]